MYANVSLPGRVIILCPNHTGKGRPLAIMSSGSWETPLGPVAIDSALAEALKNRFSLLTEDADAHRSEHAIEVELPFLQACRPDFTFVPIALGTGQFETLEKLGEAVAEAVQAQNRENPDRSLKRHESLRERHRHSYQRPQGDREDAGARCPGLFDVVMKEEISMCGFGPAVVMLTATKHLGATSAELIKYATSGDVSGDRETVVGYAGIVVR